MAWARDRKKQMIACSWKFEAEKEVKQDEKEVEQDVEVQLVWIYWHVDEKWVNRQWKVKRKS